LRHAGLISASVHSTAVIAMAQSTHNSDYQLLLTILQAARKRMASTG
jgi:hypothetical protein